MHTFIKYVNITLLILASVFLLPLEMKSIGWGILGIGFLTLPFCELKFCKEILLIYISLALLGLAPITTDISYLHTIQMGAPLILAILIPYAISRYIYKDNLVRLQWHIKRKWHKNDTLYILITTLIAYLFLPFILRSTGSYANWTVGPDMNSFIQLFMATNALGIWDELFFICVILGILKRHFSFSVANIIHSILLTSFLYELAFRGWAFIIVFIFALSQGYVFKKTGSLFYVIVIHLIFDLILYLALISAHYPTWLPIFILK